jgi:sarcosine oxidase
MLECEVAVVGLGLMGSAALYALVRQGVNAVGFDPIGVGDTRGSSHGSCRVYRRFNFESPAYTALSDQAYAAWRALETACGRPILLSCPVLEAGPPGSPVVAASRAAAEAAGASSGPATGAEANARYPAFAFPADWDVVVQESGGILLAEAAMAAFRTGAEGRIVPETARLEPTPTGMRVRSASEDVLAQRVIVAAGPWIGGLVPGLAPLVRISRQTVGWFAPATPAQVRRGAFPIFMVDGPGGFIYGFPDFEGRGVKAARHDDGGVAGPDAWSDPATDAELAPVAAALTSLIPGAAGPIVERDVCLYTNTVAADVRPDAGEEFILDRLPSDPRIIVASPCSGHGAKFATAIGEMLARLAVDPAYEADPAFRLDRYSAFAAPRTR